MHENIDEAFSFNELKWDSEFFGVSSAKAILKKTLSLNEWEILKTKFNDYEFISIVNNNSELNNAQIVGKNTSAFLADVNIQFKKKIDYLNEMPSNTTIHRALERNDQVIELANFQYSKFIEDPELANLPPQAKAMAKQQLAEIEKVTDPAMLEQGLQQMLQMQGQVPPEMKPAIDYLIQKAQERIEKLSSDSASSQPDGSGAQ